jgi:hypothetical protein
MLTSKQKKLRVWINQTILELYIYDWYQSATKKEAQLKEEFYDAFMDQLPVADLSDHEKEIARKGASVLKAQIKTAFM